MAVARAALLSRFDRWVDSGPFTARDLAIYRILFAVLILVRVPRFRIIDAYPDSLYHPPPGPFLLLTGFPPAGTMVGIEIALSVVLVALALGYRTTMASIAATLLLLYGYGTFYSLGKIDHNIFLVILPGVLLFARWGDALSIDSVLARRRAAGLRRAPVTTIPQWPLRLLAVLIGLGFLTAAIPKIFYGWLDPRTQAVRGVLQKEYYVNGRTDLLAPYALDMSSRFLWELGDIFAVAIEVAFIVCVIRWRAFRVVIAAAALFHLGVLLTMNIFFVSNVLVYGAFVSWSALRPVKVPPGRASPLGAARPVQPVGSTWWHIAAVVTIVVGGAGIWGLRQVASFPPTSWMIMIVGALVSVWYLARQVIRLLRHIVVRPREIDVRDRGRRAVVADGREVEDDPTPASTSTRQP